MQPVVIEIFSGPAGVTAACKRRGWHSCIAVDKTILKHTQAHVIQLDLTDPKHQSIVHSWIEKPEVIGVFMAPPCGTSSLARTIPIPGDANAPRPLRSLEKPDGLSGLTHTESLRVSQANVLYQFVVDTIELCNKLNKFCMVENPQWLNLLQCRIFSSKIIRHAPMDQTDQSGPGLQPIFRKCTQLTKFALGNHYHEPWGTIQKGNKKVFATALEVHYPKALCEAIVHAFALKFAQVGWKVSEIHATNAAAAASTGLQPTKPSLPPLISEFRSKCCMLTSDSDTICWPNNPPDVTNAKLLHKISVGGKDSEAVLENVKSACSALNMVVSIPNVGLGSAQFLKVFGFFWEPEEFVGEAIKISHPLAAEMVVVPKILLEEVQFHASGDAFTVAKKRLRFVAKWTSRAKALMGDESTLKNQIDPLVANVTKDKKILLFEEMLREVEFPDMGVVEEMKAGASLTGDIPITNMLPCKFVPPLLDESSLASQASLLRNNVQDHAVSSGDAHLDAEVWQKTMEEVNLSWLRGPLELSDVPVNSPITRRFGLSQKHKVRLIDDYTQSGVNHFVTVHESLSLHTVDIAASLVTVWLRMCKLNNQCPAQLLIKTFDLSSAYKKIALNADGRRFSFIAFWDPNDKRPKCFQSLVLPFGAIRSVHSFLSVARALWWIGVRGCSLLWSSFFDDFLLFSKPELAKSAEQAAISLFKLTGWLFAEEGRKCVQFDK